MKFSQLMLCRKCGNELVASEYCNECNEIIHWRCIVCDNEKSVQIPIITTKTNSQLKGEQKNYLK